MLDLRTTDRRTDLPARREPYWVTLQRGCAVGYRRGCKGGTWVARWRDLQGRKRYLSLGAADDGGRAGLSYDLAYEQALRVIVQRQHAELASAEPMPVGQDVIDEAAVIVLVEATLADAATSRRHVPPPPIDVAALGKDLTSAKRLHEARLRRRIAHPSKAAEALKHLATSVQAERTALTQIMSDDVQRRLLAIGWDARAAPHNKAGLADLLGAEATLARIAAEMDSLLEAAQIARRLAEDAPSEELEIVGMRIEYDLFARVLPRLFERYFRRKFGVRRDAYRDEYTASGARLYGPGVTFVMGAAELIGIRSRHGRPYTPDVILDARQAAKASSIRK